jgi:hypothetical protein
MTNMDMVLILSYDAFNKWQNSYTLQVASQTEIAGLNSARGVYTSLLSSNGD